MTFMLFSEETEVEILLSCYQTNEAVRELRYPADVPTSVEMGALLAQIEWGNARDFDVRSCCCWHVVLIIQDMSGMVSELIARFVPQVRGLHCRAVNAIRMTQGAFKTAPLNTPDSQTRLVAAENAAVEQQITEAWLSLHKIGPLECARFGFWSSYCCFISNTHRAYCEIVNVWPYARAASYAVEDRTQPGRPLLLAIMPDHIAVLDGQAYILSYSLQFAHLKFFGANEGLFVMPLNWLLCSFLFSSLMLRLGHY
jgi:hypothetical protein